MSPPSCARYELPAGGGVRGAEGVQASSFEAVADSANRAGPSAGGGGAVGAGPVGPPRACARSRPSVGARRAAGGRSGGESRWTPAPAAPATPPPHAGEPSHYRWGTDKSGGGRHPHRVAPPPRTPLPCLSLPPPPPPPRVPRRPSTPAASVQRGRRRGAVGGRTATLSQRAHARGR